MASCLRFLHLQRSRAQLPCTREGTPHYHSSLKKIADRPYRLTIFCFHRSQNTWRFNTKKDLSHRQARWMEFLSQYDTHFVYVQGEQNCIADTLSH
jgi:hypothetical protein